jgi:LITAF-like zinc ribbon domain
MGFFGKKKKETNPEAPHTNYGLIGEDDDLPVATMVTAFPVDPELPQPQPQAPSAPMMMPPPQQPSYYQQNTSATISNVFLTRAPTLMQPCPCCQSNARTRVVTFPNWVTWSLCVVILFIFWPLCWIPLVMVKVSDECLKVSIPVECNGG